MKKSIKSSAIRTGLWAGVAAISLVTVWSAQAQDAAQAQTGTTLAPIVLQGEEEQGGTGPVRGYVAKQTTTGSKTDTPLNEIPQSVSVVGNEEMSDRGVVDKVDQALLYTPGVFAQPYGSDPDTDWIYVRGFNASQTGLFLDNLALTNHAFGNFQIDPFVLERVEVLKGPASVLLGGANAGGVINMVRKRPTDEPYFYTEIGIDSNANGFVGFDFSDKVMGSDAVSYRLTGKLSGGNGYSDDQDDIRGIFMPQITFQPDDATSLNVWAYLSHLDQTHTSNGLLPYSGTVVSNPFFGKLDRDIYLGNEDFDIGRTTQAMLGYEFNHEFEGGWKFTQNLRYASLNKRERQIYPFDYASQTDGTILMYADDVRSKANSFNVDNRLENDFDFGGANHKIMAGIDYRYYRLDNNQLAAFGDEFDPDDAPYGTPPTLFPSTYQIYTINQVGAYVQDQIKFGDGWIATLNGRFDYIHSDLETIRFTPAEDKLSDTAWSGRAGIAYEFDNGLTPYASVATFFSPLVGSSDEGTLKPEEGEQYEAGVKYEPTWFDGVLTASVFQIDKENYTVSVPVSGGGTESRQLGEVRSRGVELEGKFNLNQNWKMIASASYTDIEFTNNPGFDGNTPATVPNSQAALWLDYTVTEGALEGLGLGAGVRYMGKSWANDSNTLRVGDATVFDAGIRYAKNDWKASLNVTNLFDKEYVSGCNTETFCGYGEARTVGFKLSKVW